MLRDLILGWMPRRWRAGAEAESRAWHLVCTHCGHAASVWDRGGLRWKAAGRPLRRVRCPGCGRVAAARMELRRGEAGGTGPDGGGGGANPA